MAEKARDCKTVSFNFGLAQTVFDWSMKLLPLLWLAFQFYANQDSLIKGTAKADTKITGIENRLNELERNLVFTNSENRTLIQRIEDDEKFYMQTQHR